MTFGLKMTLETEEQMLIYDLSAIVAAIGGSLGLFLGISCVSMSEPVMERAQKWMKG